MKKLFPLLLCCCWIVSNAQDKLFPLPANTSLYYQTKQYQQTPHLSRAVWSENGNLLIESDTLSLPFFDEFSTNKTRPFGFENSGIYDSILNVYGGCDTTLHLHTQLGHFYLNQTFSFTYNVALHKIDTIPNPPIFFQELNGITSDCYKAAPNILALYPDYYTMKFDTITGAVLSKILVVNDSVNIDTVLEYCPKIYLSKLPTSSIWIDNYAFVNSNFPLFPPTIGVATLDGLNQFGLPYNKSSITNWGVADKLTSKPLRLGGLQDADSVYLSFFYQPQGLGDWPNEKDSLTVEFLNFQTNNWDVMWSHNGYSAPLNPVPDFQEVFIRIPWSNIPKYLYDGFQFRFKNYASLTGNNDHWHIDYVRLNAGRTITDTSIQDIAYIYPYPSILKNFTEMPGTQYTGAADLNDSIRLWVRNNNRMQASLNPPATNYHLESTQTYPSAGSVFIQTNTFNASILTPIDLNPNANFHVVGSNFDSLVIDNMAYLSVSNSVYSNDTIRKRQTLSNLLAYDDGTAEHAYGVVDLHTKKAALEFNLNKPDTIYGYQIHYSNIDVDVHDLVFNFNLWKSLVLNSASYVDSPIYSSSLHKPYYTDSLNGFTTYRLDTPIAVDGQFYFGWAQSDTRNLQVGYDLNSTRGWDHLYIFTNGTWKKSNITPKGSPMIRLLLGPFNGNTSGIKKEVAETIKMYPNPTTGKVYFEMEQKDEFTVSVTDVLGNEILNEKLENNQIDFAGKTPGIYFVKIESNDKSKLYKGKIIKE